MKSGERTFCQVGIGRSSQRGGRVRAYACMHAFTGIEHVQECCLHKAQSYERADRVGGKEEHVTESVHVRNWWSCWVGGEVEGMQAACMRVRWGTTASSEHHCQAHALQV